MEAGPDFIELFFKRMFFLMAFGAFCVFSEKERVKGNDLGTLGFVAAAILLAIGFWPG